MKSLYFQHPMVQALLNTKPGTWPAEPIDSRKPCKSQTRMVMKPQPILESGKPDFWHWNDCVWANGGLGFPESGIADHAPHKVGDKLWVRETWRCMGFDDGDHGFEDDDDGRRILLQYKDETSQWVDFDDVTRWKKFAVCNAGWKPSIHMPHEAARLFLEVREVRVECLWSISEDDARREGVEPEGIFTDFDGHENVCVGQTAKEPFAELWNAIYGKGAWESNPWVFVYGFMRVEG